MPSDYPSSMECAYTQYESSQVDAGYPSHKHPIPEGLGGKVGIGKASEKPNL